MQRTDPAIVLRPFDGVAVNHGDAGVSASGFASGARGFGDFWNGEDERFDRLRPCGLLRRSKREAKI
jgi:hypothetical protein